MKLNKISLKDKEIFKKYLKLRNPHLSSYSFENIYIWKKLFEIQWAIIHDQLCVFFKDNLGCFLYLPPMGKKINSDTIEKAFGIMDDYNTNGSFSRIENVPAEGLGFYKALGFKITPKDSEYLYKTNDLIKLSGDKFKSKRSSYNYFLKHYRPKYEEFRPQMKKQCLRLLKRWFTQRRFKYPDPIYQKMLEDNALAQKTALENFKELDLVGRIIKIDGEIVGYTFGFSLNPDTFCVLFETTDLKIKGLAQYIFREFCREMRNFAFINIMDDSGLENLKRLKNSYRPFKEIANFLISR